MSIKNIYQKYSSTPSLDLDLLLSHTLKKPKEFLFAHPEHTLSLWEKIKFRHLLHLYKRGVPIAYITHYKEFFGLNFYVNKHTLVPRPDTEIMVEEAIKKIKDQKSNIKDMILIDVGTGSGCIPISIIKTLKQGNIKAIATDISKPALQVAQKNAERHGVEIKFLHGNLLEPILEHPPTPLEGGFSKFQIPNSITITANLPYLTQEQFQNEPSIQHEPYSALVAEEQGLKPYKELLAQIKQLLATCNLQLAAFFEIDPSQTTLIISEIKKSLPAAQVQVVPDLAGRDRVVCFKISS